MTLQDSDKGSVVAFYGLGLSDSEAAASFYEDALQWLRANDCAPDKLSVAGDGFSGKLRAFRRTHERLLKNGFQDIDSLEVVSMRPDGDAPITDWKMTAILALRNSYVVLAADSSIVPLDSMLSVARTTVEHLKPHCGIGFTREMRQGPSLYEIGLNYGTSTAFSGPEYEEQLRVTQWGAAITQQGHRDGLIRDVYPYNFLTEPHLSRFVEGLPLHEWITQNINRGQLSQFAGEVWLWSVEETAIAQVRDVLNRAGVIFNAQA